MKKIALLSICLSGILVAHSQLITPDLSFAGKGWTHTDFKKGNALNQYASQVLLQKDGSYLLVIYLNEYIVLGRYRSDGSLDSSFGSVGFTGPVYRGYPEHFNSNLAVLQSDGKIVLTGNTESGLPQIGVVAAALPPYNPDFALTRYNTDGSLDKSFGNQGKLIIDFGGVDYASSLAIQSDGKMVVTGSTYDFNTGNSDFALARFTADGLLDNSFDGDGKLTTDLGGSDNGFTVNIQNDDKIVITGYTYEPETYNPDFVLVRYNNNGTLDNSFDGDGKLVIDMVEGTEFLPLAIQSDRKIVLAGTTNVDSGNNDIILARYNTDGSPDLSFDGDGKLITDLGGADFASSVAIRSDGKITVAGYSFNLTIENIDFALARFNSNGSPDLSFGDQGKLTTDINGNADGAFSLVLQNDDKIVAAGITLYEGYTAGDFVMVRYNINGSLDNSFDGDGKMFDHYPAGISIIEAMAVQTDGKLVVGGSSGGRYRRALREAGLPGVNRIAAAAPPPDLYSDLGLARYNPDGSLDPSFDSDGKLTTDFGGDDYLTSIAIQSDGKIVVAISSYNLETDRNDFILARYHPDGSLDLGFDGDGKLTIDFPGETEYLISMTIQSDDKIIVAGNSYDPISGNADLALARFNTDGSPDLSFDEDGQLTTDYTEYDIATSLAIQPDGKIVVAGISADPDYFPVRTITRYNTNGSLDNSFDKDGKLIADMGGDDNTNILAIQADGKIVVTGYENSDYYNRNTALARYNSNGSPDSSFDGDGKQTTDLFNRFALNSSVALARFGYSPSLALQDNGKIILAGTVFGLATGTDFGLTRYNIDGTLDSTFGNQGRMISDFGGNDLASSLYIYRNRLYVGGYNELITPRGIIAAYHLACTEKDICGNRLDDNCDGQVDEGCPSMPYLTINNVTVTENLGRASLMVSLSKKSTEPVSVNYFTVDRSATSKPNKKGVKDYVAARGTLTIPAGNQYSVISISIINDDITEGEEFFDVHLYHPVHAALSGDKGIVTIKDSLIGFIPMTSLRARAGINEQAQPTKLSARAQPNPGQHYFNLVVQSSNSSPVTLKVVDAMGRLIETRAGVAPNSILQLGHNYRPGIYFAEIEQSGERVKMKLVKQ